MLSANTQLNKQQIDRIAIVHELGRRDPGGLEMLIEMEGQIIRERRNKQRCDKAAARLLAGDHGWIGEIRTSNEYEVWVLLGRAIAEAFKQINQKAN